MFGHKTERWIGWALIVFLCAIPVVRWVMIVDWDIQLSSWYGTATIVAKVGALVGTMLYALNFVLALRAKWLEPLFGGINRAYIAHHITGGLALIFVILHPVFIALREIEIGLRDSYISAARALLPEAIETTSVVDALRSMSVNFGIIAFIGLVALLIITFFTKLRYELWLFIHRFLGVAFLFAGLHVIYVWSDVRNDLPLRMYLVFWIGIGLASFMHRSLLGNIFIRRYLYAVSRVNNPAEGVVTLGLEPQKKRISFKAGQFIFIIFISGALKGEMHPFSLSGIEQEGHKELEITVKALGDFTKRLQEVKVHDKAVIEGAFGRFVPARYPGGKHVWIAGGIGITPFIASAKALSAVDVESITLFYSVNNPSELIEDAFLSKLSGNKSTFNYVPFVAGGENGFLSADYIRQTCGVLDNTTFFICGPPIMMKALKTQLRAKGVPKSRIITEEFSIN